MEKKYCSILRKQLKVEEIEDARIANPNFRIVLEKPEGGLWASPFLETGCHYSDWHRFCCETNIRKSDWCLNTFEVIPDSKIIKLETVEAILDFLNRYLRNGTATRNPAALFSPVIIPITAYLDWELIFKEWDALYIRSPLTKTTCFSGWDVDTFLIFNREIIKAETIESKWINLQEER